MRNAALLAISALALAACNPAAPGGGGSGVFPDLSQASYRLEASVIDPDGGGSMPMVMIRDGAKMRIEASQPEGDSAIIVNPDTGETFMLTNQGGRQMAMLVSTADFSNPAADWQAEMTAATLVGPCSAAGETGSEWTSTDDAGDVSTACVTGDGIILRGTENGQVTWETTSLQRGPQSPDLFVLPPGVQAMDVGAMMGAAAGAAQGAGGDMCATLRSAGAPQDALSAAGC